MLKLKLFLGIITSTFLFESATGQTLNNGNQIEKHFLIGGNGKQLDISSVRNNGISKIRIVPSGFHDNIVQEIETDGGISHVKVSDLNQDGNLEFYITTYSGGSGAYGNLVGFTSNEGDKLHKIKVETIDKDKILSEGYRGKDNFIFEEQSIIQVFPLYNFTDSNAAPTGGTRYIEYTMTIKDGLNVLKPNNFWGNRVIDPGPKNPEAFLEALEYIQKMKEKEID